MIEALGTQVLAKVADAAIGKAAEVALNPELALRLQQQESFRLGELQARELVHRDVLAEREVHAAAELREQMGNSGLSLEEERFCDNREVPGDARPATDLLQDEKVLPESGPTRPDGADVTSTTANKAEQFAKEERIRDAGGTFIKEPETQKLVNISGIPTELIRRP